MRIMTKRYFFSELNLLGLEFILWFAVTVGGHTAGIHNPGSGFYRRSAKLQVGESFRWFFRNVGRLSGWGGLFASFRGIVALDTSVFVVFAFFPQLVALLDNSRIGQNMAVAAKKLGLR